MQVPQRDPLQFDQGFLKKQTNKPKNLAAVTIFVTLETQKKQTHAQKSVEQFLGSITFFKSGG